MVNGIPSVNKNSVITFFDNKHIKYSTSWRKSHEKVKKMQGN